MVLIMLMAWLLHLWLVLAYPQVLWASFSIRFQRGRVWKRDINLDVVLEGDEFGGCSISWHLSSLMSCCEAMLDNFAYVWHMILCSGDHDWCALCGWSCGHRIRKPSCSPNLSRRVEGRHDSWGGHEAAGEVYAGVVLPGPLCNQQIPGLSLCRLLLRVGLVQGRNTR